MNASEVLAQVQQCGGSLHLDGDGFEYRGPAGSLSPGLRGLLIEHKPELLDHLRQPDADETTVVNVNGDLHQRIQQATTWTDLEAVLNDAQQQYEAGELTVDQVEELAQIAQQEALTLPEGADQLRLSDLFSETPIRQVYSKVLDEVVLFVADGVDVPADLEGVVYRASELRRMPGRSPEQVRAIHTTKKTFDGQLDHPGEDAILPAEELLAGELDPDPRRKER